jgi:hypothetical protein
MNVLKTIIFSLLLVIPLFISNCRSGGTKNDFSEYGSPLKTEVILNTFRENGGGLSIDFMIPFLRDSTNPVFKTIEQHESMTGFIIHPELGVIDSFDIPPITHTTGIEEKVDSLNFLGYFRWFNPKAFDYEKLTIVVRINCPNNKQYHFYRTVDLPISAGKQPVPFITATPYIDESSDSLVDFALLCKRNRGFSIDYHPSSEKFRVEIESLSGEKIFASNYNMNFTQQIFPVEPKRINDIKRFNYKWYGVDNKGNKVAAGKYKALLQVVAKPEPYKATIEFEWKGNQR